MSKQSQARPRKHDDSQQFCIEMPSERPKWKRRALPRSLSTQRVKVPAWHVHRPRGPDIATPFRPKYTSTLWGPEVGPVHLGHTSSGVGPGTLLGPEGTGCGRIPGKEGKP